MIMFAEAYGGLILLLRGDNAYKEFPTALLECRMTSCPVQLLLKEQNACFAPLF